MSRTPSRLLSLLLAQTVHRFGDESNHAQTTLTAACSDCALIRRGSNESNHDQTLSLLLAQAVQRFREVQLSRTLSRPLSLLLAQAAKALLLRLCRGSERFK